MRANILKLMIRKLTASKFVPRLESVANYSIHPMLFHRNHSVTTSFQTAKFSTSSLIPDMPLLKALSEEHKKNIDLSKTAFFVVNHILLTNLPFFKLLIEDFSANPEHIVLSGKGYSDCVAAEEVIHQMGINYLKFDGSYEILGQYQTLFRLHLKQAWRTFSSTIKDQKIEKIIIIDEGGHAIETMPSGLSFRIPTIAIEQTRGGFQNTLVIENLSCPLIKVASSAAKRDIESPLIVEELINRFEKFLEKDKAKITANTLFGIIGNGAIGSSLIRYLLSRNHRIIAFDQDSRAFAGFSHKNLYRVPSALTVIAQASYIFGCTGNNALSALDCERSIENVTGRRVFISCTSDDKEFNALLRYLERKNNRVSFGQDRSERDIDYKTAAGGTIIIKKSGFPANFDDSGISVRPEKIQFTRALMSAAVVQAFRQVKPIPAGDEIAPDEVLHHPRIKLDPIMQRSIVQQFQRYFPDDKALAERAAPFQCLEWIKNNSGGEETLSVKEGPKNSHYRP